VPDPHRSAGAGPATAKDYFSLKDYTAGRAPYVSACCSEVNHDRRWLAIKAIQCGGRRLVVWREVDNATDYYITVEYKRNGTFPRVDGNFTYDDATGETSLDGRQCNDVR
jgi:hypothetical protein